MKQIKQSVVVTSTINVAYAHARVHARTHTHQYMCTALHKLLSNIKDSGVL